MQTKIPQCLARDFSGEHILASCNWVIEAAMAVQCGDAPEWVPFGQSEAESAWDAMRIARASLSPTGVTDAAISGRATAIATLEAGEHPADFEGTPDEARELAAEVRELADALHEERDTHPDDAPEWDRLDYAGDALNDYADALESAADEPDEPEVFQAFMVSDWLGWFLCDRYAGEGVIRDDNGNFIWLRQCCGQACYMDPCILAAAREWFGDPDSGDQSRTWTRYSRALEGNAGRHLLDAAKRCASYASQRGDMPADVADVEWSARLAALREAVAEVERVARGDA